MSCNIAMQRMFCEPLECCVQPNAYIDVMVLSFAEDSAIISQTLTNLSFGVPQMRDDHVGRVLRDVSFQQIPDATRILQRIVGHHKPVGTEFDIPRSNGCSRVSIRRSR